MIVITDWHPHQLHSIKRQAGQHKYFAVLEGNDLVAQQTHTLKQYAPQYLGDGVSVRGIPTRLADFDCGVGRGPRLGTAYLSLPKDLAHSLGSHLSIVSFGLEPLHHLDGQLAVMDAIRFVLAVA